MAEDEGRDLIVMGVKGARFLVGSTTARVIGFSSQDVLLIPEKVAVKLGANFAGHRRFRTQSQGHGKRPLTWSQFSGGTLKVVSVLEISSHIYAVAPELTQEKIKLPKQYVEEVKEQATSRGILAEGFVREAESADEVIIKLARDKDIDLIVMGSHGRTGLKRLLMGSVTERVIGHAPCPVLVVKL